jgi:hypothetical protein
MYPEEDDTEVRGACLVGIGIQVYIYMTLLHCNEVKERMENLYLK